MVRRNYWEGKDASGSPRGRRRGGVDAVTLMHALIGVEYGLVWRQLFTRSLSPVFFLSYNDVLVHLFLLASTAYFEHHCAVQLQYHIVVHFR